MTKATGKAWGSSGRKRRAVTETERTRDPAGVRGRKDLTLDWRPARIVYGIRFTVRILGGITHYLSVIPLTLERSKDRLSLVYPP